jgi:hypothetical protein
MNSMHAVVVSQMTAAGVGWLMWLLLGGGYAAAACATPLAILLMILLKVEAVVARDRYEGSHTQSHDGRSRCEESRRSRNFDTHLPCCHAARAAKSR